MFGNRLGGELLDSAEGFRSPLARPRSAQALSQSRTARESSSTSGVETGTASNVSNGPASRGQPMRSASASGYASASAALAIVGRRPVKNNPPRPAAKVNSSRRFSRVIVLPVARGGCNSGELFRYRLPDLQAVLTARDDAFAVRTESNRGHVVPMPAQGQQSLAARSVPDFQGLVVAS